MSTLRIALGALWFGLAAMAGVAPADAQNAIQAMVLTTCGTPTGFTLTNGKTAPVFQDTTGTLCSAGGGGGGGLSVTDNSAWTNASSKFTPNGGVFNDSATALSSGNQGTVRLNANREMHVTVDANAGTNALYAAITAPLPVKAGTLPSTQTPVSTGATTPAQADLNGNLYANPVSQYPAGAVPITASATGTTAATTATLAASATLKTYICSYSVRANATAVTTVLNTVTGVVTATLSHQMWVPANTAGLGVDEQIFTPCVPSSAINTAVAVVSGAPGTGGLVSVTATGYQAP